MHRVLKTTTTTTLLTLPLQNSCLSSSSSISYQQRGFFNWFGGSKKDENKKRLGDALKEKNKLTSPTVWSENNTKSSSKSSIEYPVTAVYSIGVNHQGQLGLGDCKSECEWVYNEELKSQSIKSIKSSLLHSAAITNDFNIFTWGANFHMQLGQKFLSGLSILPSFMESTPISIKQSSFPNSKVIDCALGGWNGFALLVDNSDNKNSNSKSGQEIFSWGNNQYGQLGTGNLMNLLTPTKIYIPDTIKSISCGLYHTHFLLENGKLLSCGKANDGQLAMSIGNIEKESCSSEDKKHLGITRPRFSDLLGDAKIKEISAGCFHSIALTDDNRVYQWGKGEIKRDSIDDTLYTPYYTINKLDHQINNEINKEKQQQLYKVEEIKFPTDATSQGFKQVIGGNGFSMALTNDGKLYHWKIDGDNSNNPTLVENQSIVGKSISKVSVSPSHIGLIFDDESSRNQIFIWTLDDYKLEKKALKSMFMTTIQDGSKEKLFSLPNDHTIKDLSMGSHFSLIVAEKKK
ncbi:hypothetical protein CYY_005940 [Polysphondylium violaceum]|uniref:Regulator of chromosome condensation domain-containing protein n=1 Tax=Polysphondylium violaceum TaxID=133409 RepID=A0A8J4V3N7_9MYCE|nr:hypothetical protein CYY_005940 [Polysphondylium violaceum]